MRKTTVTNDASLENHAAIGPFLKTSGSETEPATLSDEVYDSLRDGLLVGEWLPGVKITARSIARQYKVSLSPARDAMTRLANEGGLSLSSTRMYSIPRLTMEDYGEVTTIRLALEPMAVESAALRISASDIEHLNRINEYMRDCVLDNRYQEGLIQDSRFHLGLYAHCGSAVLCQVIGNLWLRIGPTRNLLSQKYRRGLKGYRMHRKVLAALENKEATLAARLIRDDLRLGARELSKVLIEDN